MIEIFIFEQIGGGSNASELYYSGKKQETHDEFVGGKRFEGSEGGRFYEAMFDALNYLEEKGYYKVISVVCNPTPLGLKRYEIFTRGS